MDCSPFRSTRVHPRYSVGACWSIFSFCAMFCRCFFSFFSFGHCIVCPPIYGFWLPLWYLQILSLSFFFRSLCCLSFDLRRLITHLVSSFLNVWNDSLYKYVLCHSLLCLKGDRLNLLWLVCLLCLTPLSTIFQLYHLGQLYWWRKPEYPEKTTNLSQVTDKTLSHNVVSSTPCHARGSNSQR